MKRQIVFMFSGQGSQYYQMGKELYENHARFKYWMDHCDEIVHPLVQASLIDILYRGQSRREPFDQILYTNPALLCVEYSLFRILMEMGVQPDYLLGYSLGEITACVVSGVISLEDGIQLVIGMAKLIEEKTQPAKMLAIVESKEVLTRFPYVFQNCWLTGVNFHRCFVVSGLPNAIEHLQDQLKQNNCLFQLLPVNNGFHTELIDPIEKEYKQLVRKMALSPMKFPIFSSINKKMINNVNEDYFWNVIRGFVDFEKTINRTLEKGDFIFVDVGPSGTLGTFVKYLLPSDSNSFSLQMINQFGKDLYSIEACSNYFNKL